MSDETLGRRRRAARRAARCWWCGDAAEYLCDAVLFPFGTKTREPTEPGETCNPPLCERHAKAAGFMCPRRDHAADVVCGAPTADGGECSRVTGIGRCHQHAGVPEAEPDDPAVHACPFCGGLGERPREVDVDEHRRDARAHGRRSQMAALDA